MGRPADVVLHVVALVAVDRAVATRSASTSVAAGAEALHPSGSAPPGPSPVRRTALTTRWRPLPDRAARRSGRTGPRRPADDRTRARPAPGAPPPATGPPTGVGR